MRGRIIFLDIDGVLNNARDWWGLPVAKGKGSHKGSRIKPEACALVQQLAEQLDADIVISSTWRIGKTADEMGHMFAPFGLDPSRVIDCTPSLDGSGNEATRAEGLIVCFSNRRGREIRQWMDDHDLTDGQVVILDDDCDMGDLLPRLVKTTWAEGLDAGHVAEAQALFEVEVEA